MLYIHKYIHKSVIVSSLHGAAKCYRKTKTKSWYPEQRIQTNLLIHILSGSHTQNDGAGFTHAHVCTRTYHDTRARYCEDRYVAGRV